MFCIDYESNDPHFNLALEEYYFRNFRSDFFVAYINDPSVIIGKHQIANEEVNNRFVFERNIPVVRRISGGGTVYHDRGNINYTFITTAESGNQVNFKKYTAPVTGFLEELSVEAVLDKRSDIRTRGLKVSGNAEHVFKDRVLHHGTLLFNASLSDLRDSLLLTEGRYISRAVSSNRTSVTNLSDLLPAINTAAEMKMRLFEYILKMVPDATRYFPTATEVEEIRELANSKYHSWEWNYAYGPSYRFMNRFMFRKQKGYCDVSVKDGIVVSCRVTGSTELVEATREVEGIRHAFPDFISYFKERMPETAGEVAFFFF
jgi:lipoate---protein ligase